jgi:protein SCO1/2
VIEKTMSHLKLSSSLLALLVLSLSAHDLTAQPIVPAPVMKEVGWEQRIGKKVPLDATFRDENGEMVKLSKYFRGKPVILSLAYYECPMLCGIALEGLAGSLKGFNLSAGSEFEIVTLSFDPREKPPLAKAKKAGYVARYGRPGANEGWHFLTGDDAEIREVTNAVGFRYQWDEKQQQFAHATGIVVLTPDGTISRYFFGIEYAPKELRLGLFEASQGKVGSVIEQLLLLCYHYDPVVGKYTTTVLAILRVAAAFTILALGMLVGGMLYRERVKKRQQLGVNA